MLQRHSDINVTDAAGSNHVLGKYIAATLISKLKVRMSVIQLLEIHLLCYCSVSKNKICNVWVFVVLNVVCLFVFSIIQIISAFVFVFGSKNPIELTSVMVKWWFC